MYEMCAKTFFKGKFMLQVFLCALISQHVCTHAQLRGNIEQMDMKSLKKGQHSARGLATFEPV